MNTAKIRAGSRVRLITTGHTGTVEKVAGTGALVRWDNSRMDSHWNRYYSSWERRIDLTRAF